MKQEHLCCYDMHFVKPVYPKEARLAHIEGVVKLHLVFAGMTVRLVRIAARFWRPSARRLRNEGGSTVACFVRQSGGEARRIRDCALPSHSASKTIPPKPAYLHLANGDVIRADTVREFADRIEYADGRRTHHDTLRLLSLTSVVALVPRNSASRQRRAIVDPLAAGLPSIFSPFPCCPLRQRKESHGHAESELGLVNRNRPCGLFQVPDYATPQELVG